MIADRELVDSIADAHAYCADFLASICDSVTYVSAAEPFYPAGLNLCVRYWSVKAYVESLGYAVMPISDRRMRPGFVSTLDPFNGAPIGTIQLCIERMARRTGEAAGCPPLTMQAAHSMLHEVGHGRLTLPDWVGRPMALGGFSATPEADERAWVLSKTFFGFLLADYCRKMRVPESPEDKDELPFINA